MSLRPSPEGEVEIGIYILDSFCFRRQKVTPEYPGDFEGLSLSDFDISDYIDMTEESGISLKGLSRRAREALTLERVRHVLFLNGREGLTAAEVAGFATISEPTARRYLDRLCSIREAYSVLRKTNARYYYPNGEPLHGLGKYRVDQGPHVVETVLARGPEDRLFLHITEKRFSILEGEKVEGGIMIPFELIDQITEQMKKLQAKGALIES